MPKPYRSLHMDYHTVADRKANSKLYSNNTKGKGHIVPSHK